MVNLWKGGMQSLQIIPADCSFCFFKAASCFHKPSQGDAVSGKFILKNRNSLGL